MKLFVIWDSRPDTDSHVLFWRPEGAGYTNDLDLAGTYTEEQLSHMHLRPTDIPILKTDVTPLARRMVHAGLLNKYRR